MFVRTSIRNINIIYHKPSIFLNATHFITQYPEKSLVEWTEDKNTYILIKRLHSMEINNLFKMHFFNTQNDGVYLHPILSSNFLKWTLPNETYKFVLPEYLKIVNTHNGF